MAFGMFFMKKFLHCNVNLAQALNIHVIKHSVPNFLFVRPFVCFRDSSFLHGFVTVNKDLNLKEGVAPERSEMKHVYNVG